jgi:hypothetical protein
MDSKVQTNKNIHNNMPVNIIRDNGRNVYVKECWVAFLQNGKFEVILLLILLFSVNTNGALLPSTSLTLQEIHLVRCLTYISHRYFATGRSVVISSPSTYRDVQQELIAEIQRNAIWPVVVTVDGNINITEKSYFIDRDGSYIILIPDGNVKSLITEMNGLSLNQNIFTRLWNSKARFVVAGANKYSMSQQTDIFHFFTKRRIYNCIIVSQENYATDKELSRPINVNDVDTGMKLGVYIWFPYQSSDSCTEVNDITLLDSWVISAQGHFTKNTDLFPRKISNSLNRCPMKAVVRNAHWNFTTKYVHYNDSNGNVVNYIEGLEYDLLNVVCEQMNMTFVHVPTPEGFENEERSVNNVIFAMLEKKAYIALGSLLSNLYIDPIFDSTDNYYTTRVRWYVPCSVKYPRWSSIFRILSVELWLVLIISIVTAAISITLVGRYSCTPEWQGYKTLTSSLTNAWSVILGVSVSKIPRTPSLRSLFLAWVCFSLSFSTVFQAFLTTFLIDSGYKTPIQNMDELFASGIKLFCPEGFNIFFENSDETEASKVRRENVNCPSYDVCLNWAKYQKNVSVLLADIFVEENYAAGVYVGKNSEPLLCRLEDGVVSTSGLRMIMFHGDPLMRRVNEIINRVVESGIYNYWNSVRINYFKLLSRKIAIVQPLDEYYSFNLYHMQPAFYLLLMGLCLSVLCFFGEVFFNRGLSKKL